MENLDLKNITPEQKKEILSILSKARLRLFGIVVKFSLGLFCANLVATLIGRRILKDVDLDQQAGFQMVAFFTNAIFMVIYLNSRIKNSSDIVSSDIKEVLKK